MFITFEGGEGSGKTTIIERVATYFKNKYQVIISREPGGSFIAESIRDLVLDPKHLGMSYQAEALLYAASRAQHLEDVLIPAMETHDLILCDRYIDSSFAYQGLARGLGLEYVEKINDYAMQHLPLKTFYIDVSPEVGLSRIKDREKFDRLDQEKFSFHDLVRQAYLDIASVYQNRIIIIDGHQSIETITLEIIKHIEGLFNDTH
jgi:dTMP kinase